MNKESQIPLCPNCITELFSAVTAVLLITMRLCIPRRTLWRYTNVVLLLLLCTFKVIVVFTDINISQGSVATHLSCGGMEKCCCFKAEFGTLCICVVSIYLNSVAGSKPMNTIVSN